MRRGQIFFILAFVLILGVVAVLLVYTQIIVPSQRRASQQQATPTPTPVAIVMISQNIPKGYILDERVLVTVPWQEAAIAPGMVRGESISEMYGRQVKYDLEANTPLMQSMLLKAGEQIPVSGSPWSLNIPTGMVAVSIPVNRLSAVSYAPQPGDRVSVIVTLLFVDVDTDFQSILPNSSGVVIASGPPDPESKQNLPLTVDIGGGTVGKTTIDAVLGQAVYNFPSEPQRPRMVSAMLLQDVRVLQVGDFARPDQQVSQQPTPTPAGQEGQEGQAPAEPPRPNVITLIVTQQDAVILNYLIMAQAQLAAQISLVLRGSNDDSRENVLPITLQALLDQKQIPVPARLPYGLHPRIDGLSPDKLPASQPQETPEQQR